MTKKKTKQPRDEELLRQGPSEEEEFNDLDTGWAWVVLAASFGSSCLFGASQFASGIVHLILLDRYHASVSLTSVVGAVHMGLFGLGGPISSMVSDRFTCRVAIVTAGFLFITGCIGTAFAPTIEFAIVTRGVIAGLGGAIGYTANMVIVGLYFRKRRNFAAGLSNSGVGAGICLLAPAMQKLFDVYGPVGFFIMLAGIFAQMIVFGAVSFPSKLERYAKCQRERRRRIALQNGTPTTDILQRYVQVLKNKSVICLCVGMFNYCLGSYVVYLFLPSYIVSKGFTAETAANMISLSGILTVIGRVLTGAVANIECTNDNMLYCTSMLIVGIATIIYPSISWSFAGNLTYAVILGSFFGNCYVLTTSLSVKYIGVADLSLAIGLQFLFGGIGTLLGPVISGLLLDIGVSYDQVFYVSAFCMVFAGAISGVASCFSIPNGLGTKAIEKHIDTPALKETEAL